MLIYTCTYLYIVQFYIGSDKNITNHPVAGLKAVCLLTIISKHRASLQ